MFLLRKINLNVHKAIVSSYRDPKGNIFEDIFFHFFSLTIKKFLSNSSLQFVCKASRREESFIHFVSKWVYTLL